MIIIGHLGIGKSMLARRIGNLKYYPVTVTGSEIPENCKTIWVVMTTVYYLMTTKKKQYAVVFKMNFNKKKKYLSSPLGFSYYKAKNNQRQGQNEVTRSVDKKETQFYLSLKLKSTVMGEPMYTLISFENTLNN